MTKKSRPGNRRGTGHKEVQGNVKGTDYIYPNSNCTIKVGTFHTCKLYPQKGSRRKSKLISMSQNHAKGNSNYSKHVVPKPPPKNSYQIMRLNESPREKVLC